MQDGLQPGDEAQQGLDGYEQMVDSFAEQAKAFWRSWGTAGEPMIQGIEAWSQMQRGYLQWLRQTVKAGGGTAQRGRSASGMPPLWPGLAFDPWPGAGDSEGGGWDR